MYGCPGSCDESTILQKFSAIHKAPAFITWSPTTFDLPVLRLDNAVKVVESCTLRRLSQRLRKKLLGGRSRCHCFSALHQIARLLVVPGFRED
jgi:hypothetical protein